MYQQHEVLHDKVVFLLQAAMMMSYHPSMASTLESWCQLSLEWCGRSCAVGMFVHHARGKLGFAATDKLVCIGAEIWIYTSCGKTVVMAVCFWATGQYVLGC